MTVSKSGRAKADTAKFDTIVPTLFNKASSFVTPVKVPTIVGIVPIKLASGVNGMLNAVLAPAAKPATFEFVQVTNCATVVQLNAPSTNVAGAVKPTGKVDVKLNAPVAAAVPILLIVTGMFDVKPSVKAGDG